jgi:uncharacterized protein
MRIKIDRLIWDEWNIEHIARHNVVPEEVEEVCHGDFLLLEGQKGRLLVIGPTANDRMLTVVLNPQEEEGVYYPVTTRPSRSKEGKLYQEEKGVQDA